ncbi:MAG: phasin family protein [Alphaproteobacteria bacterium]
MVAPQNPQKSSAMPEFTKMFGEFPIPGFKADSLFAYHRKNFEAFTRAGMAAASGLQAVAKRQGEIFKAGVDEAAKVAQELMSPASPQEKAQNQAARAKEGMHAALAGAREIADLYAHATSEALDVFGKRVVESIDEVQAIFSSNGKSR